MKFTNTTDFSSRFLRRMVAWCCREVGLKVRDLRRAKFCKTKFSAWRGHWPAFSGFGGSGGITVRIGPDDRYPVESFETHGTRHPRLADRVEGLLSTTAHECYHVWQFLNRSFRGARFNEPAAINAETTALEKFRADREALLAAWNEPIAEAADAPPKPSLTEKRAAKAATDLARWRRKLKLAQTKVKHYTKKVNRYQKQETQT